MNYKVWELHYFDSFNLFNVSAGVPPPALPPSRQSSEADLHPGGAVRAEGPGPAHQQEAQRGGDGGNDQEDGGHTPGQEDKDREESEPNLQHFPE